MRFLAFSVSHVLLGAPLLWWFHPNHPTTVAAQAAVVVGDAVCTQGIAMDYFCIAQGFLLDNPSVSTLERPDLHSVHCLIEVPECTSSPYEILIPPGDGSTALHSRGYRLDDTTKTQLLQLGQVVGICGSCNDGGTVQQGLTVVVQGTIVATADGDTPPTISGLVSLADPNRPGCAISTVRPTATPAKIPTVPPTSFPKSNPPSTQIPVSPTPTTGDGDTPVPSPAKIPTVPPTSHPKSNPPSTQIPVSPTIADTPVPSPATNTSESPTSHPKSNPPSTLIPTDGPTNAKPTIRAAEENGTLESDAPPSSSSTATRSVWGSILAFHCYQILCEWLR